MIIIEESNSAVTAMYDTLKETHHNLCKLNTKPYIPPPMNEYVCYTNNPKEDRWKREESSTIVLSPPVAKTVSEPPKSTYVPCITIEMYYKWYDGIQKGTIQYNPFTAKPYLDFGKQLEEQRIQFAKQIEEKNRLARTRYNRMI